MESAWDLVVVIPVLNQHPVTRRCLELLSTHATTSPRIVLVDNGSDPPVAGAVAIGDLPLEVTVVRSPRNLGMVESLTATLSIVDSPVVAYLHNDLLVHEPGWDTRVLEAFRSNPRLGLAGVLAGRGIGPDGGRMDTHSHLLGLELGKCDCHEVAWQHHGQRMPPHGIAAAVLDGCGLFLRLEAVEQVGVDDGYPLHHWYDREWSCAFLDAGWHLRGLDIRCDHGSGLTACREEAYHRSAENCARERFGVSAAPGGWDHVMYETGARRWAEKWAYRLPAIVDEDHTVHWTTR